MKVEYYRNGDYLFPNLVLTRKMEQLGNMGCCEGHF